MHRSAQHQTEPLKKEFCCHQTKPNEKYCKVSKRIKTVKSLSKSMSGKTKFDKSFIKLCQTRPQAEDYRALFRQRYPQGEKYCSRCDQTHGIDKFRIRDAAKGLLRSVCASSDRKALALSYERNRQRDIARSMKNKEQARVRGRTIRDTWLSLSVCSECSKPSSSLKVFTKHAGNPEKTAKKGYRPLWQTIGNGGSASAVNTSLESSKALCERCAYQMHMHLMRRLPDVCNPRRKPDANLPSAPFAPTTLV